MRYEGYHETAKLPFREGSKVVIPAGVTVKHRSGTYVTKRTQTVTLNHYLPGRSIGYNEALNDRRYRAMLEQRGFDFSRVQKAYDENSMEFYRGYVPLENPSVRWAGSGGYWCEVDLNDILVANHIVAEAA